MAKNQKPERVPAKRVDRPTARGAALTPFEEMDRLFEEFFGRRWPRAWMRPFRWEHPAWPDLAPLTRAPQVDVVDGDTEVIVRAEVPGVKREDLEVSLNEETVTIRGRTSHEERGGSESYYRAEISRGEFSRTIPLPGSVDSTKATAKLENGVLVLTLPKIEKAKRHTIPVG